MDEFRFWFTVQDSGRKVDGSGLKFTLRGSGAFVVGCMV